MARVAGNTAPEALSVRQTVSLALVAIAGALSTVLIHPMIGLPIAGTALAGLAFGGRPALSAFTGLVGGVLTGLLASATLYVVVFPLVGVPVTARAPFVYTALVVASLLLVGPVTAALMKCRPAVETTVIVTSILTTMQVTALASLAAGAGQSVGGYIEAAVSSVATQAGMGDEFVKVAVSMWPGALATLNGFTAILAVAGIGVMGARFGVALRRIPPLMTLDLDVRMVVLPITAIALLAAGRLPLEVAPTLGIVGNNLLVLARWVFFLQGVAVFAGLYERAKLARPVRIMGFVLLGVTEAFAPAVSLTGLADMWLNLRRLPRDASASGRIGATPDGVQGPSTTAPRDRGADEDMSRRDNEGHSDD